MMPETLRFFEVVALEITENRKSKVVRETYESVRAEIRARVVCICKSGLNARNTIAAINEYALSVMIYYSAPYLW